MTTVTLTDSEVALLSNALYVASEVYRADAFKMRGTSNSLQAQFEKQQKDTLSLQDRFDRADVVQLIIEKEESNIEQAKRLR